MVLIVDSNLGGVLKKGRTPGYCGHSQCIDPHTWNSGAGLYFGFVEDKLIVPFHSEWFCTFGNNYATSRYCFLSN